jgi:DNA (cytosine-5)-methyltransferase 1
MTYFVKRRRAQHDQDFETWIQEGVCPTLNAFDNTGDSRATLLIVFDNSYRDGLRIQKGKTVNTLSAKMGTGGNNVPIIAFDGYNQSVTEDIYRALRIGIDSGDHIQIPTDEEDTMQVRRLTPVECERLMGWADNHTLYRADGKQNADTTRYKMCGNGVASPVAQWIGQHLMAIMNDE